MYQYESKIRPYWFGVDATLKAMGVDEYKLIFNGATSYKIATPNPIPDDVRRKLELEAC